MVGLELEGVGEVFALESGVLFDDSGFDFLLGFEFVFLPLVHGPFHDVFIH